MPCTRSINSELRILSNKVSCESTSINIWRAFSNVESIPSGSPRSHKWYNIIRNPGWTPELQTNLRVVERRHLQALLLERIQQLGGQIMWNKELKEVRPLEQGSLKLLFDDGSSADTDLLVGSDGIWSSVRKHIIQQKELDNAELRWQPDFIYADGLYGISAKVAAESDVDGAGGTHWILLNEGVASTWALPDGKQFWTISLPQKFPPERRSERPPGEGPHLQAEGKPSPYEAQITWGGYSVESTVDILRKHENVWHPASGSFAQLFKHSERIVRSAVWHKAWGVDEIGNSNAVVIGDAARVMVPSSGQGTKGCSLVHCLNR